jgi:hypothetical protein
MFVSPFIPSVHALLEQQKLRFVCHTFAFRNEPPSLAKILVQLSTRNWKLELYPSGGGIFGANL